MNVELKINGELVYVSGQAELADVALRLLALAVLKSEPTEGAWENRCPFCGKETEVGKIPHKPDCPIVLAHTIIGRARLSELSEGAKRAKLRPPNYRDLDRCAQLEIDKQLGILDWDGK